MEPASDPPPICKKVDRQLCSQGFGMLWSFWNFCTGIVDTVFGKFGCYGRGRGPVDFVWTLSLPTTSPRFHPMWPLSVQSCKLTLHKR